MLNKAKDKMIAAVAKRLLESKLARYGEVLSLSVESKMSRMTLEFLPAGETAPIVISIDEYQVIQSDGGVAIRLQRLSADRVWVANLLKDHVEGLEFPLTGAAAKLVDWLL